MASKSDWDIDFSRGLKGENLLADIVETSEVKTDYRWQDTKNIYIEYECWYNGPQEWKKSGISVTKAKYWSLVLPIKEQQPIVLSIPTELLKRVIECNGRKIECVISDNPSKGYLVKVSDIMNIYSGI